MPNPRQTRGTFRWLDSYVEEVKELQNKFCIQISTGCVSYLSVHRLGSPRFQDWMLNNCRTKPVGNDLATTTFITLVVPAKRAI